VKLTAEVAPASVNNANAPILGITAETKASAVPETGADDMVIDEVDYTIKDMAEVDITTKKTPMEEMFRVTRARLRKRVASGTVAAANDPTVD
jgi:hypothetical protein